MTVTECFPDRRNGDYQPAAGFNPKAVAQCWLVLCEGGVIPFSEDDFLWPSLEPISDRTDQPDLVIGCYRKKWVGVIELTGNYTELTTVTARSLLMTANSAEFALISHALQIFQSRRDHRFCGRCGHQMAPKEGEWAQVCPDCCHHSYPIISPCIIIAITRGDNEVLLVKHHRHQKQQAMHTLVAGFVEPGESAEEAVRREVLEETGLTLGKITYQYSQSWPFPHALMLGFHGEYVRGKVQLDIDELSFGDWFQRDNLPELPPAFTISRQLVELLRK